MYLDHGKSSSCLGNQRTETQLNKKKRESDLYNERKWVSDFDLVAFTIFAQVLAIFAWMHEVKQAKFKESWPAKRGQIKKTPSISAEGTQWLRGVALSCDDDGWNGRWKEGEQSASAHASFRPITSLTGKTEEETAEQETDGESPQVARGKKRRSACVCGSAIEGQR